MHRYRDQEPGGLNCCKSSYPDEGSIRMMILDLPEARSWSSLCFCTKDLVCNTWPRSLPRSCGVVLFVMLTGACARLAKQESRFGAVRGSSTKKSIATGLP